MTAKNCANGPKLVLKELCEKFEKKEEKRKMLQMRCFPQFILEYGFLL